MDYSDTIDSLRHRIEELGQIKEILRQVEETTCTIEGEISSIDQSLPSDKEIRTMKPGAEKEQILHLLDLLRESYSLVDEILGPPEDQLTGEPAGTAFVPEAVGNSEQGISIEEILKNLPAGSKGAAS